MTIELNDAENLEGEARDAALPLLVCRKRAQPFEVVCGEVHRPHRFVVLNLESILETYLKQVGANGLSFSF